MSARPKRAAEELRAADAEARRLAVDEFERPLAIQAGAGTGKTTVLVERFARSVIDDGLDVDSLLVITYTARAAGELVSALGGRVAAYAFLVELSFLGGREKLVGAPVLSLIRY